MANANQVLPLNDRSNLGVIVDPNVKIETGPNYQSLVESSLLGKQWNGKKLLSLSDVKDLWKQIHGPECLKKIESTPRKKVYLHELLMDSKLLIPELEIPDRNPELEKRVAHLRNSLAEKEYQRMTQNVNFTSQYKPEDSVGYQMKQMNSGLIAVFQFVISLACAFFFGFVGIELIIGNLLLPVKILLGIASALIVGSAELYFLAINLAVSELPSKPPGSGPSKQQHLKTS